MVLLNESFALDEKKQCKKCSHERRDHKYDINEQNNNLKCMYKKCSCNNFVEWI